MIQPVAVGFECCRYCRFAGAAHAGEFDRFHWLPLLATGLPLAGAAVKITAWCAGCPDSGFRAEPHRQIHTRQTP
jgi:hypothetical protein